MSAIPETSPHVHPVVDDGRSKGNRPGWVGKTRLVGGERLAYVRFKKDAFERIRGANQGNGVSQLLAGWDYTVQGGGGYTTWANEQQLEALRRYVAGGEDPWYRRMTGILEDQLQNVRQG